VHNKEEARPIRDFVVIATNLPLSETHRERVVLLLSKPAADSFRRTSPALGNIPAWRKASDNMPIRRRSCPGRMRVFEDKIDMRLLIDVVEKRERRRKDEHPQCCEETECKNQSALVSHKK
jgi:hypothetical protein